MNTQTDTDNLDFARVDLARMRRQGVPEVVYGAGKTAEQIVAILGSLRKHGQLPALATRVDEEKAKAVAAALGDDFTYFPVPRLGRLGAAHAPDGLGPIAVAAAGTSDLPVAEEAAVTAETLGNEVTRLYDVGVAGLHRLLASWPSLAWKGRLRAWWADSSHAPSSPFRQASGTVPRSAGYRRCFRCSIRVPRAFPW